MILLSPLQAGVADCYTQSKGCTATTGNFLKATFVAIAKSYQLLTPDLWRDIAPGKTPYDEYSAHLQITAKKTCSWLLLTSTSTSKSLADVLPHSLRLSVSLLTSLVVYPAWLLVVSLRLVPVVVFPRLYLF